MAKYFDKLESIRGLAAFAVVLFHSPFYLTSNPNTFVANSYLFVDLFFILSGFVMANAYSEKISEGFKFRDYFFLRLGRIYPLYIFLLIIWAYYIFGKWLLYSFQIEQINPLPAHGYDSFIASVLMIQSLNLFIDVGWNYPAWSVSVEFYTYFIFFVFVWLVGAKRVGLGALVISFGCYLYLIKAGNAETLNFTLSHGIFRSVGGFFAGVFLFEFSGKLRNLKTYQTVILELIAVGLTGWFLSTLEANSSKVFFVIPIFVLTIYVFSLEKDGFIGKILKLKLFANAGKYSYSIYLIHALILDVAFSLIKYFVIKSTTEIYYWQSDWSYLINLGLIVLIYFVSGFTYKLIEKRWIAKSKNLVEQFREMDKKLEEKPSYV